MHNYKNKNKIINHCFNNDSINTPFERYDWQNDFGLLSLIFSINFDQFNLIKLKNKNGMNIFYNKNLFPLSYVISNNCFYQLKS